MNKGLKIFLVSFILSLPFWLVMNVWAQDMRNFFFWQEFSQNPRLLTAQAAQSEFNSSLHFMGLARKKEVQDFTSQATSAVSVLLDKTGRKKILFEKNASISLPIASVTKLMTAKIILENYDLQKEIVISKEAVAQEENLGKLIVGDNLTVQELLYPLLMESSNDAAFALVSNYPEMTREKFIILMNDEAKKINMTGTYFYNPTGLEPEEDKDSGGLNLSTANDLVKLMESLKAKPLLWDILQTSRINLYGPTLINGNKLLGKIEGIWGGKTGYTEQARGCFVLVVEAPQGKGLLLNVVLGAEDRFLEMEKLINWVKQAYAW
jgi:serine-type D-Ala-D-Ala carboxypeptidase (penicillin-binding protein 5/6)